MGNPLFWLVVIMVLYSSCQSRAFEQACVGIAPGTPLAEAARRLEAVGGEAHPIDDDYPTYRWWGGTRTLYPSIVCLVSIDRHERVEWTRFDKVYIWP